MSIRKHGLLLALCVALSASLGVAQAAATVYTGDVIQGKRVISQLDVRNSFGEVVKEYKPEVAGEVTNLQRDAMIEPGTRVVQVLYDGTDPKCDGDGRGEENADCAE